MTVVVGVRRAGQCVLAADRLAVDSNGTTMEVVKLTHIGDAIAGVAGSTALLPIVRRIEPPAIEDGDEWAQHLAERITADAKAAGVVDGDGDMRGVVLLARGGSMWELFDNVALPIRVDYHAIGSGAATAFGALHARLGDVLPLPQWAGYGVAAAVRHVVDCGGGRDMLGT